MKVGKAFIVVLLMAGTTLIGYYTALLGQHTTTAPFEKSGTYVNRNHSNLNIQDRAGRSVMLQRVDTLRQGCKKQQQDGEDFDNIQGLNLRHLVVNDEHKLIYCYIPKVACTNMKRVFLILTGKLNESNPLKLEHQAVHFKFNKYLRYLKGMPISEIKYRLQNYTKIIFVREPFERILSAYRDKFVINQDHDLYFKHTFGREIIKTFRNNSSKRSLQKADDVTYTEFVQFLHQQKTLNKRYDEHWATYTDLCHPCHIKYDFIGKYEHIDEDVNVLLDDIGVSDTIKFPKRNDTYNTLNTKRELYKYYKDLKLEFIKNFVTIYATDFQLFDYKMPDTISDMLSQS